MSSQPSQLDGENLQVAKCRQGDPRALTDLRDKCHKSLLAILLARGADQTEAEDLLADLWADCVPGNDDRPSLLEKFSGRCTLQGWLATVATNRWIDTKRKQARHTPIESNGSEERGDDLPPSFDTTRWHAPDQTLVSLLRNSLKDAFAQCGSEVRVLLRLVYLHELSQREIVRMLGWSESKVSRYLSNAMEEIEKHTLAELKRRDPWLELSWRDFVDLCEIHHIGFL
jgi:RNA polymerase sigma factor (sigma-70 family)